MRKLLCLIGMVLIIGCGDSKKEFTAYRIHKVKRVFAHGVGSYSVMVEDKDTKEIKHEFVTSSERKAKIVADVLEGEEMWVEVEKELATIHIRSSEDIGGGKKTDGKITKTTNVVK